jgi:D-beta-D-heptose 7-phosphate kinase/D-beta-D-heptose 1-phosphate adenosyltransferase
VVTPALVATLARLQAERPRLIVADAKHLPLYRELGVTAVKPNYAEAVRLLGLEALEEPEERAAQIGAHEEEVLELCGAPIAAVTIDTGGALIFERGQPPYRTYARPRPHSQAAGAGDTFVSALTLALAAGAPATAAAELASAAAAVVVAKDGTTPCTAEELRAAIAEEHKVVGDLASLQARLAAHREQGRRIVFTNGCFDILHRGHITYLSRAKALGDVLIVGLNADESIRRLKGEQRPINTLEDRAGVMAALSCVDHIVPFAEDTPAELLKVVRPDVFVKGGDYSRETLPEAALVEELGGRVVILGYLENRSTTSIIERIQAAYSQAANGHGRPKNGAVGERLL